MVNRYAPPPGAADTAPGPLALPARLDSGGGGALGRLMRQTQRLLALQSHLADLLPEPLHEHCTVVGLDRSHLRLLVSSSVRATQVRYLQKQILAGLGERIGEPLTRLEVSVRTPGALPPTAPETRPPGLSAAAAAHLERVARDEPDQNLRKALERLATRIR